jgi:1-acyl-sn-glycerol-3-phosphate acyltransferase
MALFLKKFAQVFARFMSITAGGMYWYKYERVNYDYKKYLGPDWNPPKGKAASYVGNHSMWMDIFIATICLDQPRFTAKEGIRKWPLFGLIGE